MFEKIKFANMDWQIIKEEEDKLYLRTVESIGEFPWDIEGGRRWNPENVRNWSECGLNWSECDIRSYLNGEFYDSLPEEDREKIIPVINKTNTRELNQWERTEDKVWLNGIEDISTFMHEEDHVPTWLRNPCVGSEYYAWIVWDEGFPDHQWASDVFYARPCVCIRK